MNRVLIGLKNPSKLIYIIVALFFILSFLSFANFKNKYSKILLFISIAILLFLIAAFRGGGVDRDYGSYFSAYKNESDSAKIYEPTFQLFTYFTKNILNDDFSYLIVIYAFFGVLVKLFSLYRLSSFPILSCLLYLSYFFTLQEMTQIRVGAALSFFLLSLTFLYDKKLKYYLILISIAVCFHFSSIIFLFLYFLDAKKIKIVPWLLFLIFSILSPFFLKPVFVQFFESFDFLVFQNKILAYGSNNNAELNVFNVWIILKIAFALFLIWKINLIEPVNKYSNLFLKIYILSISSYYLLSFNPVFASRINDMLSIVEVALFPSIIYLFKPKYIGKFILIFYAACFMYLNLFYLKIFN